MTEDECYEISLIERLLAGKEIKESTKSDSLLRRFKVAGWVVLSGRRNGWRIHPHTHEALSARLRQIWPSREIDLPLLHQVGLTPEKSSALLHLPSLRRKLSVVLGFINNHTWSTLFGAGPKKAAWRNPGAHVVLTQDAMSRLRPNKGLEFINKDGVLKLDEIASILTEIGIPQRAILNGGQFAGRLPDLLVTIENLGAFVDAGIPENVMLIYSPGFDLRAAEQIVRILPQVPWVHFGDLDPEGLLIWEALKRATNRSCQLHVPAFAGEYLDIAQKPDVPWGAIPDHPVLVSLKLAGKGIFQEAFVLDERLVVGWSIAYKQPGSQSES